MGYIKAIICGQKLELFTYEKNIRAIGGKRGKSQSKIDVSDLGEDTVINRRSSTQEQIQKRRDNTSRAGMAFRRLVSANLGQSDVPLFFTLTYAANQTNIEIGYQDFKAFIGGLRYKFGNEFRYVVVPEFQKRGALHFHALFWGLPSNLYSTERSTRLVASIWGRGFVDVVQTDGNEKLVSYLGKYMQKSYNDSRLLGKRAFSCSRNVKRPIIERGWGMMYLEEVYGIGVDNPPCEDREFLTQWLGKGRFRLFNLKI